MAEKNRQRRVEGGELSAEYKRMYSIRDKCRDKAGLDAEDYSWLAEFLDSVLADEDVRDRIYVTKKGTPLKQEKHLWIALDYLHVRRHVEPYDYLARSAVADLWQIKPDPIREIVSAQKPETGRPKMQALLDRPEFCRVIEWQRQRLLEESVAKVS